MIEIDSYPLSDFSSNENLELLKINEEISYSEFFDKILLKNRPCILSSKFTLDWPARKNWVKNDGLPDFDYLKKHFGHAVVPVADCNMKYYNSQGKETCTLSEYSDYWDRRKEYKTDKVLYLKDWHFMKEFSHYKPYSVLKYFGSDWLNEFWKVRQDAEDDYQFVYIGPSGSWTPFHSDVFQSYSWSANICGCKRWVFYPPGEEIKLSNKFGMVTYDVESADLQNKDEYPIASSAAGMIHLMQNPGEVVFVPSGWYHQVWNVKDTISINHNWINGTNIDQVWKFLVHSLEEVEVALHDVSDMEGWERHCQLTLKSTHGMDLDEFSAFLCIICERRLEALKGEKTCGVFSFEPGREHILFDLKKLKSIILNLLDHHRLNTVSSSLVSQLRFNLSEVEAAVE